MEVERKYQTNAVDGFKTLGKETFATADIAANSSVQKSSETVDLMEFAISTSRSYFDG